MKAVLIVLIFIFSFSGFSNPGEMDALYNNIMGHQTHINPSVWRQGVTTYLSKCASGDCPCALVLADGSQTDNTTVKFWIGSFDNGQVTKLWEGMGSRFTGQFSDPVNIPSQVCEARSGKGSLSGNQVCVQYSAGPSCRDVGIFRTYMQSLGVPETVGYTSFYFSNRMEPSNPQSPYKFHDFYPCESDSCPSTLGCLGLNKFVMKSLCLNHFGSSASENGHEAPVGARGGWLYFHNMSAPSEQGSEASAKQGLQQLKNGICNQVSKINLGSGEYASSSVYSGGNAGEGDGSNVGGNFLGAFQQGLGSVGQLNQQQQLDSNGQPIERSEDDDLALELIRNCEIATQDACSNVDPATIAEYCKDERAFNRSGCEFERSGE